MENFILCALRIGVPENFAKFSSFKASAPESPFISVAELQFATVLKEETSSQVFFGKI